MINSTSSKSVLVICVLLIFGGLGCDKDRPPAGSVPWGPLVQGGGKVKLSLIQVGHEATLPLDAISSVTLLRYTREAQDEGAGSQRWPGDTSGQYTYTEIGQWDVLLSGFPGGLMPLESGIYQFKHNSVSGQPPSGFYGHSDYFEVKAQEDVMLVQIQLNAAI